MHGCTPQLNSRRTQARSAQCESEDTVPCTVILSSRRSTHAGSNQFDVSRWTSTFNAHPGCDHPKNVRNEKVSTVRSDILEALQSQGKDASNS